MKIRSNSVAQSESKRSNEKTPEYRPNQDYCFVKHFVRKRKLRSRTFSHDK